MKNQKLFLMIILASFLFPEEFEINENSSESLSSITFSIGDISFENKDGYKKINSNSKGQTQNYGKPELPTYTMNYAVLANKEYLVDYSVLEYETYENIILYPSQPISNGQLTEQFIKDEELYDSNIAYPEEHLNVHRQSLRGHQLLAIELIPYEYNPFSKELKIYKTVEININETEEIRESENTIPKSEIFENMYSNMVINDEMISTDSRDSQDPSVLYIMEDYSSLIEPLVEWRRKQGFIVNVIDVVQLVNMILN